MEPETDSKIWDLCDRVWAKVPKARPDRDQMYKVSSSLLYPGEVERAMIRDACVRWLLENDDLYLYQNGGVFGIGERFYDGDDHKWSAHETDFTTCLLLAVERCHEYHKAGKTPGGSPVPRDANP